MEGVFESKGMKINPGKTKIMVNGGITNVILPKSEVSPCGICSLRAKANSILCAQSMVDVTR